MVKFFTSRGKNVKESPSTGTPEPAKGAVPTLQLEKAALAIEKRARGMLTRPTTGAIAAKAHRTHQGDLTEEGTPATEGGPSPMQQLLEKIVAILPAPLQKCCGV